MSITSPQVSFGLYGLSIKQDSIPSTINPLQPFSKIADLRTDNATNRPYITYEPNFWLLDGGYKFLPADTSTVHVGMMSLAMSDAGGNFAVPPVLTVNFGAPHTTDGLTLRFAEYSGNFASLIDIKFYDALGALIRDDLYTPTSWEFSTGQAVSNFQQIVITFEQTNLPYRYLRLTGIDYGQLITLTGLDIKSASVIEEIDMLSAQVPINTLDLLIHSADADFSIINPSGYFAALQKRQPLAVHELVDNQTIFIGNYYLDKWANKSDTEIEFSCVDLLGVLDSMPYLGGIWLGSGIALSTLIEQILGSVNIPYELDTALASVMVTGWLPACTYREALQHIGFAVGAYVTCARNGAVEIYSTKIAADSVAYDVAITKADKGQDQSLTLNQMVTGVEVTVHNYIASTDSQQLYNGALNAGSYTITFDAPMHDLSVTGAAIAASGVNYAVLNVTTAGTVTLTGLTYTDTAQVKGIYTSGLDASVKPNVLKVTDATLVNANNVTSVAQRIYDYYQQRYLQKVKLFAPLAQPGDVALIDTLYNQQIRGVIEKMSADLANGFTVQAEITGVVNGLD
jgi:hypothetical protein